MTRIGTKTLYRSALRYGVAVASAVVAITLRAALAPYLTGAQFITFYPAVVFSAYFGGRRPGILTAVLCGFGSWYLFVTPIYSFALDNLANTITLIVYFATSTIIALLIGTSRAAARRERASGEALRASEEQFRVLADSSPALIWVTDTNAQVTFANRRHEEVFGAPANSIEGEAGAASSTPKMWTTSTQLFSRR